MSLTSTTLPLPVTPVNEPTPNVNNAAAASVLAALMLALFTAQSGKKALRKLKKQAVVTLLKYKVAATMSKIKSLFTKGAPAAIDNRTLLFIVLGIAVIILLIVSPIAALVLVLIALLVYLLLNNKS